MSALTDIWHAIQHLVTSADNITLVIAVVLILAAGLVVERLGGILNATLLSLIALALAGFIRAVTVNGKDFDAFATADWHSFLGLQAITILAYVIVFAVLIAVVHFIRTAVGR